jgi:DNA-binding transcriptional ArsR family regulator
LDVCAEDYTDPDDPRPYLYIPLLATHPGFQGRGIGRQIVRHLIEVARQTASSRPDCIPRLLLDVYADNIAGINLYTSSGFATISPEPIPDPDEDDRGYLVMALAFGGHAPISQPTTVTNPPGSSNAAFRDASQTLKSVSDPTRLRIILALAEKEHSVGGLCALMNESQPAVSHHLALLRFSEMVIPRREAYQNFYSLTDRGKALAEIAKRLV